MQDGGLLCVNTYLAAFLVPLHVEYVSVMVTALKVNLGFILDFILYTIIEAIVYFFFQGFILTREALAP